MKPYHVTLEPGGKPIVHPPRSVPVNDCNDCTIVGVITRVDTPTDWVNCIVLSESTNDKGEITKLRVCLDPRDLKE